jgi:hypothetical protein
MRRLTLILCDLYLSEESRDSVPAANLEWLLRYANARRPVADWRTWLASELGYSPDAIHPLASFTGPRGAWFATPVHLLATLDHVRLDARGLLALERAERAQWSEAFARTFGPQYALHDDGVRGFYLSGLAPANVSTTDPARLLGADIAPGLPRGADAGELRRLNAEIEMWLHAEPLNAARGRRGVPPVSALWLWGGGVAREIEAPKPPSNDLEFVGDDIFIAALARDAGKAIRPVPEQAALALGENEARAAHRIVVLAPMSSEPRMSLPDVDRLWLGAARRIVERGDVLDVVVNDWVVRVSGRVSWRFWRRPVGWTAGLAHPSRGQEA